MLNSLHRTVMLSIVACLTLFWHPTVPADETRQNGPITFKIERELHFQVRYPDRAVSPDGKFVLRGEEYGRQGRPASFRLYEAATNTPVGPAISASTRTTALAVAADNQTVAICSYDIEDNGGEIHVYDGKTGKQIAYWAMGTIKSIEFEGDSKTLKVVCGRTPKG